MGGRESYSPRTLERQKINKNRVSVVRNFIDLMAKDGEVCVIREFETADRQCLSHRLVLILDEAAS